MLAEISAVAKPNSSMAPYCIPNEVVCEAIGRALGLPVPPGAVLHAGDAEYPYYYGSLDFNLTGESLPPVEPEVFIDELADVCTGICLFDIFVMNIDRHVGNISVDTESNPLKISCFDHGHALFGAIKGQAEGALTGDRRHLSRFGANDHCLIRVLPHDDHFDKWFSRIKDIRDYVIEEACMSVVNLGANEAEAIAAKECLIFRRNNITEIVAANKDKFRAITEWKGEWQQC